MSLAASNFKKPLVLVATCCLIPLAGALGLLAWQCDLMAKSQPTLADALIDLRDCTIGGSLVLALLATLGCSVFIKQFLKPIESQQRTMEECEQLMSNLRNGDLRIRLAATTGDEFSSFREAVNSAMQNLHSTICTAAHTNDEVIRAAQAMREGSLTIADEASHQGAALEQLAASLEQMTQMTSQTSQNSGVASDLANETYSCAQRGDEAMSKMVAAIARIKSSADQQARIVRTIDEIAFQTNILAVNVAVEAARVGEAGRGFAVVADEVRALAQRCSEAAQSTAAMIEAANKHSAEGVQLTDEVGFVLSNIQERARRTNNVISSIAAATRDCAAGIEQASDAVYQLDGVTQKMMSSSHRSADVADGLRQQVTALNTVVERFQLEREIRPQVIVATTTTNEMTNAAPAPRRVQRVKRSFAPSPSTSTSTTACHSLDQVFDHLGRELPTAAPTSKGSDIDVAQSSIDAMLSAARTPA